MNINAEFNLMPVNPTIECFQGILSLSMVRGYRRAPPFFVESLRGRSNRSLPRLPLHMHAEDIIPTFLTSNIYIGLCLPKGLTLTLLRSYEMFEVMLIVGINKSVGLRAIPNFHLPRDMFPYRLAREIPLKECVPYRQ